MAIPAVSHFMSSQPATVERTATLADAHDIMRGHQVRHLPVLDNGQLCGIVTERDLHLIETLADADPETVLVEEAMHENPFIVTADTPLDEVLQIMAEQKYGSVIVVGRNGVEGIFTTVDACQVFAQMLQREQVATL
ncbi:MAG TPA: CBS domain-containing protein [Kofleriaceae bacterium]|jgi:acetoin utilization protein AcuB|nr:CBS domain-containing protein [Kofleriaceae bacterium]